MLKFRHYKYLLACMFLPVLGGCEYAVQTWIFTPDVRRETSSQCYETHGMKLVPWANELVSEKKLKPLFKAKPSLSRAQKNELIYSRINQDDVAEQDPLNPLHSGFLTIGLQNPISIPITAMIAATDLPALKKEHRSCQWKVTVDSALQNIMRQEAFSAKEMNITPMESETAFLTAKPEESGVFINKHPEDYLPQ